MELIINIFRDYNCQETNLILSDLYNFCYIEEITLISDDDIDYITNKKFKNKWRYLKEIDCSINKFANNLNNFLNLKKNRYIWRNLRS